MAITRALGDLELKTYVNTCDKEGSQQHSGLRIVLNRRASGLHDHRKRRPLGRMLGPASNLTLQGVRGLKAEGGQVADSCYEQRHEG